MLDPVEYVKKKQADSRVQKVFDILVSRAPNGLRLPLIRRLLPDMSEEQILQALNTLVTQQKVDIKENRNAWMTDRVIRSYWLKNPTAFPMKEEIEIAGISFPRAFQGDMVGAEDINWLVEAVAEYDNKLRRRVEDLATNLTRRYWANIATLLGVFVAVFALILRGSEPVARTAHLAPSEAFILNAASIGPLALVLLLFVLFLRLLLRNL